MNEGNGASRRRALMAGAVGHFVEWYDFGIYGVLATTIATEFFSKSDPTAGLLSTFAIFAVGFFFRPLGGIVFGRLGDKVGRRSTLILAVLLMSASTFALGLLPTYAQIGLLAPVLLVVCRVVQGISAGGEATSAMIFLVEHARPGSRGRFAAVAPMMTSLAAALGASVALLTRSSMGAEELASWGWRVPFLAALPLGLIGLYMRLRVGESPVFTELRNNGLIEAAPVRQAFRVAKKTMLILIAWTMATNVAYYLMVSFLLPYLTATAKFTSAESLLVLIVGLLVVAAGAFLAGWAADRVGRRPIAIASSLGLAIWAIPSFMLFQHSSVLGASLVLVVFAFFYSGFATTNCLLVVDLFPANVRTTASALAYQLSAALFGGTAPFVATWLLGGGNLLGPAYYLAGVCAVAFVVAVAGSRNRVPVPLRHDVMQAPIEDRQEIDA